MSKFPIPTDALDDRLAILGTAGSGKTYLALSCMERLLDVRARVVGVDPLGVMWGLRLMPDGKTESPYPVVIFGGEHGDLPLTENAGALIGETVATIAESCLIDLSDLPTKSAERRFMLAFLEALYHHTDAKKRDPYHLIVDEADRFAPQKPPKGDEVLLNRMEEIVRRGRVKGFIPWLITQRPAVLNKNVLSQADGLVLLKLTSSQDRDQVGEWIEGQADRAQGKAILASLPTMQRGQGVVWIPGRGVLETVSFPEKKTFDSSRTPKRGERKRAVSTKPLDLGALKEKLAGVEAETKANDPKALKAEIGKLKAELKQLSRHAPSVADKADVDKARALGKLEGEVDGFRKGWESFRNSVWSPARAMMDEAHKSLRGFDSAKPSAHDLPKRPALKAVTTQKIVAVRPAPASPHTNGGGEPIGGPLQRILNAIAWWNALGIEMPDRTQIAFVAGYKPGTGTFNTYMGALKARGLIDAPRPGLAILTMEGNAVAEHPSDEPDGEELRRRINAILSGPQSKLLGVLIENYPKPLHRDELAEAAGYAPGTGTFNTYLGSLNALGITDAPERGHVAAAEWLFPNARISTL